MKRLVGTGRSAVRTLQIIAWGSCGACVFIAGLGGAALRARSLNRHLTLDAAGRALRLTLEHLGATFIKLGQVASTRPDLVPPEIIIELVKLQEEVRPFPFEQVRRIIEEDFGAPTDRLSPQF